MFDNGSIFGVFLWGTAIVMLPASGSALDFTSIDFPGARSTVANGINGHGDVVGEYVNSAFQSRGFLLHGGEFSTIEYPGASFTSAKGINTGGDIVGWYQIGTGPLFGFLLREGVYHSIGGPNGTGALANGINDFGEIVGGYSDSRGSHGFLLRGRAYTSVDFPANYESLPDTDALGISLQGIIVGDYLPFLAANGFVLRAGGFTSIQATFSNLTLGTPQTNAFGINGPGEIAGTFFDAIGQHNHGFLLNGGVFTVIDYPGTTSGTVAHGINDQGAVVGGYGCPVTCMAHGFIARQK